MPSYKIRVGWEVSSYAALADEFSTYAEMSGAYFYDELAAGPVDDGDVLHASIERRAADVFRRLSIGRADLVLDNTYGRYSPGNDENVRPNQTISIKGVSDAGSIYSLFNGHVQAITLNAKLGRRAVRLVCDDHGARFRRRVEADVAFDTQTGSLAWATLSGAGVPQEERLVDTIPDLVTFAWLNDITGGEALNRVIESGAHRAAIDGRGRVVVKDRNFDVFLTAAASYQEFSEFDYEVDDSRIVNEARITSVPRQIATSVKTVAWIDDPLPLPRNEETVFFVEYVDPANALERETPVVSMEALVASGDYYISTQQSAGTDLTSSNVSSVVVETFATGARVAITHVHSLTAYLQRFQLRGYPLERQTARSAFANDGPSIDKYEKREREIENNLIRSQRHAETYASYMVDRFSEPLPEIGLSIKNVYPDVLQREIFDLIHVVESHTNVGTDYIVAGVEHTISWSQRGHEHEVAFVLRRANPGNYLILDDADKGKLDDANVLGF